MPVPVPCRGCAGPGRRAGWCAARAGPAPAGLGAAARGVRRGPLAAGPGGARSVVVVVAASPRRCSGCGSPGRGRLDSGTVIAPGGGSRAGPTRCAAGAVPVGVERAASRHAVGGGRGARGSPPGASARPDRGGRRARRGPGAARRGCGSCRPGRGWPTRSRPPVAPRGRPTCPRLNLARVLVDGEQVRVPARRRPGRAGVGDRGRVAPGRCGRRRGRRSGRCRGAGLAQHRRPRRARHAARGGAGAGPAHPRLAHGARAVHQRRRARRGERHRREAARPAQPAGDAVSGIAIRAAGAAVSATRLRPSKRDGGGPAAARGRPSLAWAVAAGHPAVWRSGSHLGVATAAGTCGGGRLLVVLATSGASTALQPGRSARPAGADGGARRGAAGRRRRARRPAGSGRRRVARGRPGGRHRRRGGHR